MERKLEMMHLKWQQYLNGNQLLALNYMWFRVLWSMIHI